MAELIRILPRDEREAYELSDALSRRGLIGEPVRVDRHWEVDVPLAHEDRAYLVRDVMAALETWLDDHHLATIPVRVGAQAYILDAHSGLSEDLSATAGRAKRNLASSR